MEVSFVIIFFHYVETLITGRLKDRGGWLINRWLLNGGSTVVTLAECHTRTAAQRLSFGSTKLKKLAENFTAMLRKLAESFTQKYTQTTQK